MYLVLLSETYITRIPEDDSEERRTTRTLLGFKNDEEADEALVSYYESQDDSYQVTTQRIGYVDKIKIPKELIKE